MTTAMTPWPFNMPESPVPEIHVSLAEAAREDGISLLYHFDREDTKAGGYTIAFRPSKNYTGRKFGKMVDVAVSYCSEGDVFSKKIGRDLAISNFLDGKFVTVPALLYGEDALHDCLREMFSWDLDLYDYVD
jgi:hypothetical protein